MPSLQDQYAGYVKKYLKGCYIYKPNYFVTHIPKYIPSNIDTIIIVGCTNGRDFLPFINSNKKYRLIGMDVFDENFIEWVDNVTNIEYYKVAGTSDILKVLDKINFINDNTLFNSTGTLSKCGGNPESILDRFNNFIICEFLKGDYDKYLNLKKIKNYKIKKTYYDITPTAHIICKCNNMLVDEYLNDAITASWKIKGEAYYESK